VMPPLHPVVAPLSFFFAFFFRFFQRAEKDWVHDYAVSAIATERVMAEESYQRFCEFSSLPPLPPLFCLLFFYLLILLLAQIEHRRSGSPPFLPFLNRDLSLSLNLAFFLLPRLLPSRSYCGHPFKRALGFFPF